MFREHFHARHAAGERDFRWRGGDVSRIEALSDAVFALALTLIVVSLEVPRTFAELLEAFRMVPVFLVCFALLFWIWVSHYQFHRRYGLEDGLTIFYNALLLFVVLLYVYPLKFLFSTLWSRAGLGRDFVADALGQPVTTAAGTTLRPFHGASGVDLMVIYGLGYAAIFAVLGLMTVHAYRWRQRLELDAREVAVTLHTLREHAIQAAFGLLSAAVAGLGHTPAAGWLYFGIGPAMGLHGWISGRRIVALRPRDEIPA